MPANEVDISQLQQRLAPVGVDGIRPLSGGASSLTYAGELSEGGRRVVVKIAPPGVAPVLHRDVLRQASLMRALATTEVPVPEVLWEDEGEPPAIPPLFVMSFVEGATLEPLFDPGGDEDEAAIGEAMRNAARTLAHLHRLDPDELGVGAEQRVGLADEIQRWCRLLETVDAGLVPGWRGVADRLAAGQPPPQPWAIVHGDFRLGNLVTLRGRIVAVIDWEIWSVGDPRVDLGWFLLNGDPATYRRTTRYGSSVPSLEELTAVYSAALGREPSQVPWFQALASFKSAATWSLIVKHNRRRSAPDPSLEEMASVLPSLLERAGRLLG